MRSLLRMHRTRPHLNAKDAIMETKTINLRISADAAEVYESASAEEKRKIEALISSRWAP